MHSTAREQITTADIEWMVQHDDFNGFGYLAHEHRTPDTDQALAEIANRLELTYDDVFIWANSRPARHAMDDLSEWNTSAGRDLIQGGAAGTIQRSIERYLPELRAEVGIQN